MQRIIIQDTSCDCLHSKEQGSIWIDCVHDPLLPWLSKYERLIQRICECGDEENVLTNRDLVTL